MATFHIRFLPEGRETTVDEGKTLLEAARAANVHVGAICGGEGTCGKCRLIVRNGEVDGNAVEFFTRDEIRHGYVLACQAVPAERPGGRGPAGIPADRLRRHRARQRAVPRFCPQRCRAAAGGTRTRW